MALVDVPAATAGLAPLEEQKPFEAPPPVVTTPCDPWSRPYFLENGLRRVAPYHYTYNTYCKERWRGRELLDIFSSEFRDRPLEYYVGAATGRNGAYHADKHSKMQ
jgi:tRNA pseudouridine32 synthase